MIMIGGLIVKYKVSKCLYTVAMPCNCIEFYQLKYQIYSSQQESFISIRYKLIMNNYINEKFLWLLVTCCTFCSILI